MQGISGIASRWQNQQPWKAMEPLMPSQARKPRSINAQGPRWCGHFILPHTPPVKDPAALMAPGRGVRMSAGRPGGRAKSVEGLRLHPLGGADAGQAGGGRAARGGGGGTKAEAAEHASRVRKREVWPEAWAPGGEGDERWRPIPKAARVS